MPFRLILAASLILAGAAGAQQVPAGGKAWNPLTLPNRLDYSITWNGIPAGYGRVSVALENIEGSRLFTVEASGRTSKLVDIFWQYRGTARAMFLADGLQPLRFTLDERENGKRKLLWIDYDSRQGNVRGVRFKKGKRRVVEVEIPGVVDPILAIFRARASEVESTGQVSAVVFTGRRLYDVRLHVDGRQIIEVTAGRYRALRLKPQVLKHSRKHPGRKSPDRRLKDVTIWVTDDPHHVLLRVESSIFVGQIALELVDVDPQLPALVVTSGGNSVEEGHRTEEPAVSP